MSEKSLADMLYVGTIQVDVGVDWAFGTPTARTVVPTLGAVDLGGEISTELLAYEDEDEPPSDDYPPFESVEMWKMLLLQMRDMLARCFIFGKMRVNVGLSELAVSEGAADKNLDQAITELGDENFLIAVTPEIALSALSAREEDNERLQRGLEAMLGFVEAQQSREGENITIGEAVDRAQQGAEDMRRMVEGEEPEEDDA